MRGRDISHSAENDVERSVIVDNSTKGTQPFGAFERMLAFRYIRAKREHGGLALISIVSTVGVTLAVFALITIMSIMNGFRLELLSKVVGFEPHVYVNAVEMPTAEADELARKISLQKGVVNVAPVIEEMVLADAGGRKEGVSVKALRPHDLEALDLVVDHLVEGDLSQFGIEGAKSDTIVIGEGLARTLGVVVGSRLKLLSPNGPQTVMGQVPRSKVYTVNAIYNVGNEKYDRYTVIMPIEHARLFFSMGDSYQYLGVRLEDPDKAADFVMNLRKDGVTNRYARDWKSLNAQLVGALVVERNVMRLIMMIVVMITALNIITGVLMLVKNKARDIAILRTIGATRGGVVRIFLMSGSILGGVGVGVGLVFGVLFVLNIAPIQHGVEFVCGCEVFPKSVYQLNSIPAKLQWSEVAIVTGWAFLMTVLTTLIPSMWASRLDPVEALRNQ
ncbi:lipoprotein-releasing ABC transporter permease subunit [Hirschia litorea]|uniref:Lipoprotein-releasing ABC transporter permease subunit n=1 Tax=Hirschia litorea TaxID=1199156 RepID=A0ABW2IH92_9PROT